MAFVTCSTVTPDVSNVSTSVVFSVIYSISVCSHCFQVLYVTSSASVSPSFYVSASPSLLFGFSIPGVLMHISTPGVSILNPVVAAPLVVLPSS